MVIFLQFYHITYYKEISGVSLHLFNTVFMCEFTAKMKQKEEMEKRKEEFKAMLKRQLELHVKSRTSRYPCSEEGKFVYRFAVPDAKVPWEVRGWSTHTTQDTYKL